jgi:hypothetical protein
LGNGFGDKILMFIGKSGSVIPASAATHGPIDRPH